MKKISVTITIGVGTKCTYLSTVQKKCESLKDINNLFKEISDKLPEANLSTALALGEMGGRK